MPRTTTICVSEGERTALEDAKAELYQTKAVPHGQLIQRLINNQTSIDIEQRLYPNGDLKERD